MKTQVLGVFLFVIAGLFSSCANMNGTTGKGAVADSTAGQQASSKAGKGSLGAFLHSRHNQPTAQ